MTEETLPIARPVQKEPTVTKAAPTGRKFPCEKCGARLDFDPLARGLSCPYCGHVVPIERDEDGEVLERCYFTYLDQLEERDSGSTIPGRENQVRCTGCGAMVLLEDRVVTEQCPFCHTHLENHPETACNIIVPESILPFAVDLRGARKAFDRWLHSLWFAPTELKKIANLGQLTGVYLPYFTYDSMTYTVYTGQRGDNYQTTEWYTERMPDGSTRRASRTVTKIRWSSVSGQVQHFFDDVLVCSSKSLPEDLVDNLLPWRLEKLEPFQPSYLSGFKTERYAVGLKEGFGIAREMMQPEIHRLICQDIGGDHQSVSSKKTRYSAITFKHLLLPMWVAVYRYHDQTYQVLVNGRTGKVSGKRPWSIMKIARLVILILLAIGLITFLVMRFGGGG